MAARTCRAHTTAPRRRSYPMPPVHAERRRARARARRPVARAGHRRSPLLINSVHTAGARRASTAVPASASPARRRQERHAQHGHPAGARERTLRPARPAPRRRACHGGKRRRRAELGRAGPAHGRARHVVVAAGAIESARLLLVSDVGTAHDQVGRYLQGHVYAGAAGRLGRRRAGLRGPRADGLDDRLPPPQRGILGGGILVNEFVPIPIEAYSKLSAPGWSRWGQAGSTRCARPTRARSSWSGRSRRSPPPRRASRRAAGDRSQRRARRAPARRPPRAGRRARADSSRSAPRRGCGRAAPGGPCRCGGRCPEGPSAGQHQAGTCRMGTDPRELRHGRVGPRLGPRRRHASPDGSLHVTNGGVNPVLTILALAWRVSERLAGELGPGQGPPSGRH